MADLFPPTLAEMIHEVERELAQRDRVYARWVASGKMLQAKAGADDQRSVPVRASRSCKGK